MNDGPSSAIHTESRKLAAIMFTDIVGFSRQMGADEARMLRLLAVHNLLIQQAVTEHHGHVIKTIGDAFLVEFPSVVHAVQCVQRIQSRLREYNTAHDTADQIHVRIGIHLGDIVQQDEDVFSDGVNIAARLQTLAELDTICISQKVYEEVEHKLSLGAVIPLGKPTLKNIAQRFHVYLLLPEQPTGLRRTLQLHRLKLSRRCGVTPQMILIALVLITGATIIVQHFSRPILTTQPLAPSSEPLSLPDKPSIVVLPFDNMSGDPQQDYFSNGITEVLTSDLSRIASLFVIARNTAFTYKGKATNVQDIGKELGVRYVLEGSVQKTAEHVRIVAQLIDTTTGSHIWSERYDRPLKDIFALQDDIVQKIVTTLKLQLSLQEQGFIVRKHTDNLEAYDTHLRAVEYYYRTTKEANTQARELFEKAIELDPQYAEAYSFLGLTYYIEWAWQWSQDPRTLEQALVLGQRAVTLDDSLPRPHGLLSLVYAHQKQFDRALAESELAIALDLNNADSYVRQAQVLIGVGRSEEALGAVQHAVRLNPRTPGWYSDSFGVASFLTGRYAQAISTFKSLLARNPNLLPAYPVLSASYVAQWLFQQEEDDELLEQALAAAQRALTLNDAYSLGHQVLGVVYLCQKQYAQAVAELERAVALAPNDADRYAWLAQVLSRVGRSEEALEAATQALQRKPGAVDVHLLPVGVAYYLAGQPEEAIVPLKQYLARYPNMLSAHLTLAAVYAELGKETEAQVEATEVLRINPKFSLEVHKQRDPIKDPTMLERQIAALRKAGLK
ncbi:MAG: tetratricopeptide repeat protein [Candidatus Binatia bacterium]